MPFRDVLCDADPAEWVIGDIPEWGKPCLDELVDTLLSAESPFPCTFAIAAARKQALRFGFLESLDDERSWEPLVEILASYLDDYRNISRDTSLAVIVRPEPQVRAMAEYHKIFWSVLRFLHQRDPLRWPAELPEDPDDPLWEFAFGGEPIFVVANTPAHRNRRSRHSSGLLITFQPRWVFEGLEPEGPRGAAARRVIRKRLRAFDEVEPSPALGDYGNEDNREWRQYFLPDDNQPQQGSCPFHS